MPINGVMNNGAKAAFPRPPFLNDSLFFLKTKRLIRHCNPPLHSFIKPHLSVTFEFYSFIQELFLVPGYIGASRDS